MNTNLTDIAGEYYLRGIPELASGFKLEEDNSFEFFMIYGTLDRYGSGKWETEKDQVIFQSKPWTGKDFALLKSKKTSNDHITVKIVNNNAQVLRYVLGSLSKEATGEWVPANDEGLIQLRKGPAFVISLVFELCPERFSVFTIEDPSHNYFEFRLEPWLTEFFFTNFKLTITEDGFKGGHPAMKGGELVYEKNKK